MIEQLQRIEQPEQHLAARRIRQFYMIMKMSWIGTVDTEPGYSARNFREWIAEMESLGKYALVELVKREARAFASIFVASVKERLKPTWNYIQALELIDPMGPELDRYATPAVWDAFRDLCTRRGVDYDECKEELLLMRAQVPSLDVTSKAMIRTDLCGYLRHRRAVCVTTLTESSSPQYDLMCMAIFSIPLTSAFVESLFSKMAFNQNNIRTRLKDETMSSILHVHDAVVPDPQRCLSEDIQLKVMSPRYLQDKLVMNKMLGARVCDVFGGTRYHGEVTQIIFHEVHAQYMYHVVYTDGDECDYWRQELEMIRCRCVDVPDV